jgi:hypothetical protein
MEGHSLRRHRDLTARHERRFIISAIGSALGAIGAGLGAAAGAAGLGAGAAGAAGGLGAAIGSALPAIGAAAAAAGTGYAISAGESGKKAQQQAMNEQRTAQQAMAAQARSQQRQSQQAMAAATRAQPDVAGIMQQAGAEGGPTTTMLTGPMGVNPQDLQLGRQTLLGG